MKIPLYLTMAAVAAVLCSITASDWLIGAALVALLIRHFRFGDELRFPPVKLPLGLFFAATMLSTFLSGHPFREGIPGIKKFYVCLVLLLVTSTFRRRKDVRTFVVVLAGVALLSSLWSFGQFAEKMREARMAGIDFRVYYTGGARITGFVSHWMTLSGEQMMVLILLAALLLLNRWDWRLAACGAVIAVSLVLGYTRSMWAGTLLGIGYLVWLRDKRWLLIVPVPVLLLLWWNPAGVGQRILSIYRPAGDLDSNRFRAICRETGVAMIRAHPWFGLGPEQVRAQFLDFIPASEPRPLPPGAYIHLHNLYLQYAAERGIPALLVFLWFLGKMLLDFARVREKDWVVYGAIAVTIAVLSAGWYEHNLGSGPILTLFLGICACAYCGKSEVPPRVDS